MKAMVFAAGVGSRLRPWTLQHPKALVPVCGVPMIERVITKLIAAGVTEMVVNVHHFAQQIIDFLAEKRNFGITIHVSDESGLLLDTGGGVLAARKWLEPGGEPFVVHNADILTDFDLQPMMEQHMRTGAMATLLAQRRDTQRYLLFYPDGQMAGWTNVGTGEVRPPKLDPEGLDMMAFGGVHIMSASIFSALERYDSSGKPFPIMPFYISECQHEPIYAYCPQGSYMWHDVGKPQALARAEEDVCGM